MKAIAILTLTTLCYFAAHAESSTALSEVQAKRKANLERTVKLLEHQHEKGICGLEDVIIARIRLCQLSRSHTSDWTKKKEFQSKIVNLQETRLTMLQRLQHQGVAEAPALNLLRAEQRFLAARQKYLQIEAKANKTAAQDEESDAG